MAERGGGLLLLEGEPAAAPAHPARFSVWIGQAIPPRLQTIEQVCAATRELIPTGSAWDEIEVLIKAGEGGSWQARHLHPSWGDPHRLAIDSEATLRRHHREAAALGVRLTPYVVLRGRGSQYPDDDWSEAEQVQIGECFDAARRVSLNLEPGIQYWNGPFEPGEIDEYYAGIEAPRSALELSAIPRHTQVMELGGTSAIRAHTNNCGSAAWECYGIASETLRVDVAIPRIETGGWAPPGLQYRIPIVQHDEVSRWAYTEWAIPGLQVWWLEGN